MKQNKKLPAKLYTITHKTKNEVKRMKYNKINAKSVSTNYS